MGDHMAERTGAVEETTTNIATVSGIALVPGVSRNNRRYSREIIAKAVARAQERIAEGARPLTMLTHHAAGDDSTKIVGSLTSMTLGEDGSARFTAEIADTREAHSIAGLVSGKRPHLRGVSIRGAWVGNVRRENGPDGRTVETADDLELDGLDFTRTPGVIGAGIDDVRPAKDGPVESAGRHMIYESAEALVTFTDQTAEGTVGEADGFKANTKPPGAQPSDYADPGYQKDKKKRYLLDTKAHAKAAWSFIGQADNAKLYTGPQLKRIKQRIVKALKKFGVEVNTAEGYLVDPIGLVAESADLAEYYADEPGMAGSFCIDLCNGPLRISISSWQVDPADLDLIGRAAMDGAIAALMTIDPDMDGDMDVPGADSEDDDDDAGDLNDPDVLARRIAKAISGESAPEGGATEAASDDPVPVTESGIPETPAEPEPAGDTEDPAPVPAAVPQPQGEEPAMAEPTTPAVEQSPAAAPAASAMDALNTKFDKLTDAIGGLVSRMTPAPVAQETAPVAPAPVAEAIPAAPAAVAETQEQMIARLVAEGIAAQQAPVPVAETEERRVKRLIAEGIAAERTRIVQETVEAGGLPTRKGLVQPVNEHRTDTGGGDVGLNQYGVPADWPNKPLHQYSAEERGRFFAPAIERHALGSRSSV